MLTKKQKLIYDFIREYVEKNGISPSLDEIAEHFSEFLAYPSSAHYHVKKLQEEGLLEKETNRPRSIALYDDKTIKSPVLTQKGMDAVRIPILGAANAGPATLFAEENIQGYLKISRSQLPRTEGVFALRVIGDSMNKAKINGKNIEEGDYVLIDSTNNDADNNDYVLSVIDGCANLKKLKKNEEEGVVLMSESTNLKHKPIFVSSYDDFMINGKIFDIIKK
ncbi:repressor LexA [Candidatus Peregrinibacteria bacterium CG10_big_fil_rev_8_21_14_0_10_36_19]|nr:MAG: repressor LexA [Candidatus Peregrinibacteria bacterium CG10_big_fil_rev_8_21_14_0_10_36_19]